MRWYTMADCLHLWGSTCYHLLLVFNAAHRCLTQDSCTLLDFAGPRRTLEAYKLSPHDVQ